MTSSTVLALSLAAGPLLVSSAASAATQNQLASFCRADVGLRAVSVVEPGELAIVEQAAERGLYGPASELDGSGEPIETILSARLSIRVPGNDDPVHRSLRLMSRPGLEEEIEASGVSLGPGEALLPDWFAGSLGLAVGSEFIAGSETNGSVRLKVAGVYQPIPTFPASDYWCEFRKLFRPSATGDPAPPIAFVDRGTIDLFSDVPLRLMVYHTVPPLIDGITRTDLTMLDHQINEIMASWANIGEPERGFAVPGDPIPGIVGRSNQVARVVLVTALSAAAIALIAAIAVHLVASVLTCRRRSRELRIRLLRGEELAAISRGVAGHAALPVAIGTLVGFGLAVIAVKLLGPAPQLETGPLRVAAYAAVASGVLAMTLSALAAIVFARRLVDPPAARSRRRKKAIPWEFLLVPLLAASYLRLSSQGGARLIGGEAQSGDFLAQSFPLLAVATILAVFTRPLAGLLARLRTVGARLRPGARLGWRRILSEPQLTLGIIAAGAVAVAAYASASIAVASSHQMLFEKAVTFIGSDLAFVLTEPRPLPESLAERSTYVDVVGGRVGDKQVDLIGVDLDTFADAVRWESRFASQPLDRLLSLIDASAIPQGTAPTALVVGELPSGMTTFKAFGGASFEINPTTDLSVFPRMSNGSTLVVIDKEALNGSGLAISHELWIRDPQPGDQAALAESGIRILYDRKVDEVFDSTAFLTTAWSYAGLRALGVMIGAAVFLLQFLLLGARRRERQQTVVLIERMGIGRLARAIAALIEFSAPLLAALAVGGLIAIGFSILAVPLLDGLRNLAPSARAVIPWTDLIPIAIAFLSAIAGLILAALVIESRTRAIEVMRATA